MVKTITIMDDAYEILKKQKEGEESFSEVIRRLNKEQKTDLKRWFGALKNIDQERFRKIREQTSKDIEERAKRLRK